MLQFKVRGQSDPLKAAETLIKKAISDISVFKVVREVLVKKKTVYSPILHLSEGTLYELGYHYYQTGKNKFDVSFVKGSKDELLVTGGLSSYSDIGSAKRFIETLFPGNKYLILKATIPTGSYYFSNLSDIESDNLIIEGILK